MFRSIGVVDDNRVLDIGGGDMVRGILHSLLAPLRRCHSFDITQGGIQEFKCQQYDLIVYPHVTYLHFIRATLPNYGI